MEKCEVNEEQKMDKADVGKTIDLFWAVADVYCSEKHLEYSLMLAEREGDDEKTKELIKHLCGILDEVRRTRAKMMKKLLKCEELSLEFDTWCPFKHLAGATMQIMEVATREIYKKNIEEAREFTKLADQTFQSFWQLYLLLKAYSTSKDVEEFKKQLEEE